MSIIRAASHAGSWYEDDGQVLDRQLSQWLEGVQSPEYGFPIKGCKAIIGPHAGYAYSGPTAAWAYRSIDITGIKRVFVLGPSHHIWIEGCALSPCTEYETPIGNLPLDRNIVEALKATGKFEILDKSEDEAEHSLEMHLPYIRKVFEGEDIKIVPIVVGGLSGEKELSFGAILAPYLTRRDTMFVVSSDFCHWGTRFHYTYYYPVKGPGAVGMKLTRSMEPTPDNPIHESISQLDHEAMDILTLPPRSATSAHSDFTHYLARTKNTICGRHPIGVLLGALSTLEQDKENFNADSMSIKWGQYTQSNACSTIRDSSVSYSSAWIRL
ncbi:UPF0103-domain-containing protein [Fistulina hepatica ATCC 64428]|uniref:UPF0103-domain-containing protein n=1 Tax=Fistulina hepatica ATCC 64428 TaxID=1128425 RepID=A0A0D7AGP2_9AGAR|nr:UPF0103-domain-containing protein [Fistulina hepatica ATCC 64428]